MDDWDAIIQFSPVRVNPGQKLIHLNGMIQLLLKSDLALVRVTGNRSETARFPEK